MAGTGEDTFDATRLDELLDLARARYGAEFTRLLGLCRVWIDGDEPSRGLATPLTGTSEVAIVPPVSGG